MQRCIPLSFMIRFVYVNGFTTHHIFISCDDADVLSFPPKVAEKTAMFHVRHHQHGRVRVVHAYAMQIEHI